MKTNFDFIAGLFNNAEQTAKLVNILPTKAYRVRINGNIASIEAIWISKMGGVYGTKDVRTVVPSMKQLNRLQKLGESFFVYED